MKNGRAATIVFDGGMVQAGFDRAFVLGLSLSGVTPGEREELGFSSRERHCATGAGVLTQG